ncbi:hypothetical protein ACWEWU_14750 [Staphylococcus xylosus]
MSLVKIKKARKKPVEIEFIQFNNMVSAGEIERWSDLSAVYNDDNGNSIMTINTLEGTMIASHGDYIIKGVHGEFYPCKPEIFHKTYDVLEEVIEKDCVWSKE